MPIITSGSGSGVTPHSFTNVISGEQLEVTGQTVLSVDGVAPVDIDVAIFVSGGAEQLNCKNSIATLHIDTANASGHFEDANGNPVPIGGELNEIGSREFFVREGCRVSLNNFKSGDIYIYAISGDGSYDDAVLFRDIEGNEISLGEGDYEVAGIYGTHIISNEGFEYATPSFSGSWSSNWWNLNQNADDVSGASIRQILPAYKLNSDGNKVKLFFAAGNNSLILRNVSIGEHDQGGNTKSEPVKITFNNGKDYINIPINKTIGSDYVDFEFYKDREYVVIMDVDNITVPAFYSNQEGRFGAFIIPNDATYNVSKVTEPKDLSAYTVSNNAGVYGPDDQLIQAFSSNGTSDSKFGVASIEGLASGNVYILKHSGGNAVPVIITDISGNGPYTVTVEETPEFANNILVFMVGVEAGDFTTPNLGYPVQPTTKLSGWYGIEKLSSLSGDSENILIALSFDGGHTYSALSGNEFIDIVSDLSAKHGGADGIWKFKILNGEDPTPGWYSVSEAFGTSKYQGMDQKLLCLLLGGAFNRDIDFTIERLSEHSDYGDFNGSLEYAIIFDGRNIEAHGALLVDGKVNVITRLSGWVPYSLDTTSSNKNWVVLMPDGNWSNVTVYTG